MPVAVSFVRFGSQQLESRLRFALALGTLLTFVVYKLVVLGLVRGGELWLGVCFDSCAWALLWLASEALGRARFKHSQRAAALLFFPLLYASAALVFAHTWFFDAAIERRLTALDVSLSGIVHFFGAALPPAGYGALVAVLLGVHLSAYLAAANLRPPRLLPAAAAVLALAGLVGVLSARAARTPSVLFDTGAELFQLITLPRLTPRAPARPGPLLAALDRSAAAPAQLATPFKKIVVLVMETMTERKWREEGASVPSDSFLHSGRAHTHRYTRYFPNNQDSRTGMLDMLTSRLIPYEAYGDADVAAYQQLAQLPSLVDLLRKYGYRSAFAVSQTALEEVVSDLHWDEYLHLDAREIEKLSQGLVCLQPDEYENGCEDIALLPELIEFLRRNERAFVYQEFIWGHAYEYNAATGRSNAAYYSGYVDWLLRGLAELGVLDETLVVLTSDHGFRDKGKQAERWVYEIPLLFYATRFSARRDARLFSHVDFKELLLAELGSAGGAALATPVESPLTLIVGPTGSGMLAAFDAAGGFTLLRRRAGLDLLLTQRPARGTLAPGELLFLFDQYRSTFDTALRGTGSVISGEQ
jgi:hypothetical protein